MAASETAGEKTYYELLGVERHSTEKEITKAYRKKALKCHPDKNPDNPNAAELFHKLSKAFEVIGNPKAKAAYDATLRAKERARLRVQAYDSKRKRFKEDLEQREKSSQDDYIKEEVLVKNLEQEIERLREEGLKMLQKEQELMKQQIEEEREKTKSSLNTGEDLTPKLIKIRWKCQKNDPTNGGYSQELLQSVFIKHGNIKNIVVSSKRGSAIIEFKDLKSAEMAIENEKGNPANPLKLSWLEGSSSDVDSGFKPEKLSAKYHTPNMATSSITRDPRDYESLVMRKLRQAEERKRLCEELEDEDVGWE
ncbi:dnaJ homolog subfamily C member 17-like [Dendronephthya gigantea]|uniref:dnaJ homolog subfamily C member 17-like n=1 Tax=Dendronephthya gigantea TaxID=151771 RepID=UPI00106C7108|nr:dnaJ homolog subfamily C member 17-like [Dendronephthya gigantea]